MRFLFGSICVLALAAMGCSETAGAGGSGGTGGVGGAGGAPDLEWPPNATAYFDKYGILSADCATDEDCAMVLGYYHAADRFVQMDFRRRFPTGRLTEIVDRGFADSLEFLAPAADSRALFSTRDGEPLEQFVLKQASSKTIALLEAYSAGVNQWIDDVRNGRNDAEFPREAIASLFTRR